MFGSNVEDMNASVDGTEERTRSVGIVRDLLLDEEQMEVIVATVPNMGAIAKSSHGFRRMNQVQISNNEFSSRRKEQATNVQYMHEAFAETQIFTCALIENESDGPAARRVKDAQLFSESASSTPTS